MTAPIHIYYKLDGFFQNHKRYVRSRDDNQLHGKNPPDSALNVCQPQQTLQMHLLSLEERAEVTNHGSINPCGLAAWSHFNDSFSNFTLSNREGKQTEEVPVNSSNLVWASDREVLFGNYRSENYNNFPSHQGGRELQTNISDDEHFMVWMKYSTSPSMSHTSAFSWSIPAHFTIRNHALRVPHR